MKVTQGAKANLNGKVFEQMVIPIFKANGFEIFTGNELNKKRLTDKPLRYVVKNATYKTIYGETGRTEFVIVVGKRKIRIEIKYQSVAGSVDEKYPYMLLNAIYQYPEKEVIFIVDGGGYKLGARRWLETNIKNNWLDFMETGKNIKLMTIIEFMSWFNSECF